MIRAIGARRDRARRDRARRDRARRVALVAALLAGVGCGPPPCAVDAECPEGFTCASNGRCFDGERAGVRWLAPNPDTEVSERFTALVEVSVRAPEGHLVVERDHDLSGEACAPAPRLVIPLEGNPGEALVQEIPLSDLRALGSAFGLRATVTAAAERRSARLSLRGPSADYGGARFHEPASGRAPADAALTVPITADVLGAPSAVWSWVEPLRPTLGPTAEDPEPSARTPVERTGGELGGHHVPLARGPQIVWLRLDDGAGGQQRCGLALEGTGEGPGATPDGRGGLELGLSWDGPSSGLLDLRARLLGPDGDTVCTSRTPGEACIPLRQTQAPGIRGEEVLLMPSAALTSAPVAVEVVVVAAAAGPPLTARVRVSLHGVHVGWFGPVAIQPALGEAWRAGRVLLEGASSRLQRLDERLVGAPF